MCDKKSLESTLFTWEGWDEVDTLCPIFYNPVLVVDIGEFKAGTKLDHAVINFGHGTLELVADACSEDVHEFELHLQVGKKL